MPLGRALCSEGMAQVVEDDRIVSHDALRISLGRWLFEPQVTKSRALERSVELVSDEVVVEVSADLIAEHQVVGACEVLPPAKGLENDHGLV